MKTLLTASLSAPARRSSARGKLVRLSSVPMGQVQVDVDAGIIRNAAVMTVGEAKGHGFEIDDTSIRQTYELLKALPEGARIRLKHPEVDQLTGIPKDGTGTTVGRLKHPRIVNGQLRGDIHLGSYAANVPGVGDVRTYVLTQAAEDPTAIGLSAVIHYEAKEQPDGSKPARVFALDAVDFAEDPAAKALMADHTVSGLAHNLEVGGPQQFDSPNDAGGVMVVFEVTYRTDELDPYKPAPGA